ncbi:MAG: hypothetical protein WAN13_07320, partial [Candidatus Acidiferrales bacterium]
RNLRTYDQQYARAQTIVEPLAQRYPRNPIFVLLLANLNAELGRREEATVGFRAAGSIPIGDPVASSRVQQVVKISLAALQ